MHGVVGVAGAVQAIVTNIVNGLHEEQLNEKSFCVADAPVSVSQNHMLDLKCREDMNPEFPYLVLAAYI